MVALLERDAELADAGISYCCRDLEHALGRSSEEFRGLGHALFQEILVNRDSIHLTETGLQRCAGDSKLLGQHLNRQSLIQVPHQVFLNLAYGFQSDYVYGNHTAEVRPAPLAVHGAGTKPPAP